MDPIYSTIISSSYLYLAKSPARTSSNPIHAPVPSGISISNISTNFDFEWFVRPVLLTNTCRVFSWGKHLTASFQSSWEGNFRLTVQSPYWDQSANPTSISFAPTSKNKVDTYTPQRLINYQSPDSFQNFRSPPKGRRRRMRCFLLPKFQFFIHHRCVGDPYHFPSLEIEQSSLGDYILIHHIGGIINWHHLPAIVHDPDPSFVAHV